MTDTAPPTACLPDIAGFTATARWADREQWTTCHIGHLKVGTVFALPDERPIRPVVLAETPDRLDVPDRISPHMDPESAGVVAGTAFYADSGVAVGFKLRADTAVLTCCDLYYIPAGGH